MADIVYLSREGLEKLENELHTLKTEKRVEIAEKLKEAISFWDLSENAEYEEARNEQAQVEHRISELEEQLKHVEIIDEDAGKENANRVTIWKTVTIINTQNDENITVKIVGTTESDILEDVPKISNESPIGTQLLGKKKWQIITVNAPSGKFKYKIQSFS